MRQSFSLNRALYGRSPGWFLPLIFGTVVGMGVLLRRAPRRASLAV
jgi:hypothetical protein